MKISSIIRNIAALPPGIPTTFRVGEPPVPNGCIVTEILYCRDGYSSGSKGKWPCYVVKFEGVQEVRVIPETQIIDVAILPEEKKQKANSTTEAAVELPE